MWTTDEGGIIIKHIPTNTRGVSYVPGLCEDDQGVPGGGVEQHHEAQQPQRVEEGPLQPPGRPGH